MMQYNDMGEKRKEKLKHKEHNICRSNIHLEGIPFHSQVFYPKGIKTRYQEKNVYKNVHGNFAYNSPGTAQMHICWITNRQILVYRYDRIVFINNKQWTTDTYNHIDESQKRVDRKKPGTKDNMLYDPICLKLQKTLI